MNRHAEELFIKETLQHCKDRVRLQGTWPTSDLELDINHCIKIVEKWVKEDKS